MSARLDDGRLSHDDVARLLGTTEARVVRIERRALRKMRRLAVKNGWDLGDVLTVRRREVKP